MNISTSNQHIAFHTNPPKRAPLGHYPQPQTLQLPRTSFPHATGPPGLRSLWPPVFSSPRRYPGQEKLSRLSPRSSLKTMQPNYMTHDGSPSWNSTFNPLSLTLPSQHQPLILHCACDLPLYTTPQTALTTQHRLNAHKFNTIISTC